jgi:hypothetical protein
MEIKQSFLGDKRIFWGDERIGGSQIYPQKGPFNARKKNLYQSDYLSFCFIV